MEPTTARRRAAFAARAINAGHPSYWSDAVFAGRGSRGRRRPWKADFSHRVPSDWLPHSIAGLTARQVKVTYRTVPDGLSMIALAKWHLAHTTRFFETFAMRDYVLGYRLFDDRFSSLFNSDYGAEGTRIIRAERRFLTRPMLAKTLSHRSPIGDAQQRAFDALPPAALALAELGCHHEE
jgi:hypothetical protein